MELASIWEEVAGQGLMFWAATGAVALGLTLIMAAGVSQVKRNRSKAGGPGRVVSHVEPAISGRAPEVRQEPEVKEQSRQNQPFPAAGIKQENSREMRLLLARLRSAADKLEDFRHSERELSGRAGESSLKDSRNGVDYLFRTGTG